MQGIIVMQLPSWLVKCLDSESKVLQSMGSQKVRQNLVLEQQQEVTR